MTSNRSLPRPVLRLVAAIVAVCAALAAVAWSGLGTPRLAEHRFEIAAGGPMVYAWVEVRNEGRATASVEGIEWVPRSGLVAASVTVAPAGIDLESSEGDLAARVAATEPFEPFDLAGGEERVVLLLGKVVCMPAGPTTWELHQLEVTASAPLGPARTTRLPSTGFTGNAGPTVCEPGS
jgi:hypothetical protein